MVAECGYCFTFGTLPGGNTWISVKNNDGQVWRVETDDPVAGAVELMKQVGFVDLE